MQNEEWQKAVDELQQLRNHQLSQDYVNNYLGKKTPQQIKEIARLTREEMADPEYQRKEKLYQEGIVFQKQQEEQRKKWLLTVPEEIIQLSPEPANETYTRYIWGTKRQIAPQLKNGLNLNSDHDSLPSGWYYTHVGSEEWVSLLGFEYSRSGPVVEITIENLPDGFYLIEDLDVQFNGKVPHTAMLISKSPAIPPQCVKITNRISTERSMEENPQYGDDHYYENA